MSKSLSVSYVKKGIWSSPPFRIKIRPIGIPNSWLTIIAMKGHYMHFHLQGRYNMVHLPKCHFSLSTRCDKIEPWLNCRQPWNSATTTNVREGGVWYFRNSKKLPHLLPTLLYTFLSSTYVYYYYVTNTTQSLYPVNWVNLCTTQKDSKNDSWSREVQGRERGTCDNFGTTEEGNINTLLQF